MYPDEYGNGLVGAWNRKGMGRTLETTTERMARQRAKEINEAIDGGSEDRIDTLHKNRGTTFATVMEAYLKVTTWSASTLEGNRARIKHINERWGQRVIASITPHEVGAYLHDLLRTRSIAKRVTDERAILYEGGLLACRRSAGRSLRQILPRHWTAPSTHAGRPLRRALPVE